MPPLYKIVPPPRKFAPYYPDELLRDAAIRRDREQVDRWRTLLAMLVVFAGMTVAAFALWQARTTRTVYVPVPMETPTAALPSVSSPVRGQINGDSTAASSRYTTSPVAPPSRMVVTAPTMPMYQPAASSVAMPTPVDYAARDRQVAALKQRIEEIDGTIRRVRADPHWYGIVKGSTYTARQQSSDAYLDQLDKERNDLRRQKWALEGR